jgi:hypothetical protein
LLSGSWQRTSESPEYASLLDVLHDTATKFLAVADSIYVHFYRIVMKRSALAHR